MDPQIASHPSAELLLAFGVGKLDDASAEVLGHHLERCAQCRKQVEAQEGDDFLARLRQAHCPAGGTVPARAMQETLNDRKDRTAQPPPAKPIADLPAELVNHPQYEILRELGRGGMGVVYLAMNRLMNRREVLKVVNPRVFQQRGGKERFLREIQTAALLNHPNVVAAYSVLPLGEMLVFAMEYIAGEDLAKVTAARGPLPIVNACYYIQQAALGLQHAFEWNMVHRDIKPQNLVLCREGKKHSIKILDFGLAKVLHERDSGAGLTDAGQALGTPEYMAPEQFLDASHADIRADIYSLGCTFYFLLTGAVPFSGTNMYEIFEAHRSMDAKPLDVVRPEIPEKLAAIVGKMLAKEPAQRYQTPVEVAQALAPFLKADAAYKLVHEPPAVEPAAVDKTQAKQVTLTTEKHATRVGADKPGGAFPSQPGKPGPRRAENRGRRRERGGRDSSPKSRGPMLVAAGVVCLALLLGAVVIRLTSNKGQVIIEVDEPGVEITVKEHGAVIQDRPGQREITLSAGEHELEVLMKDATGFTRFVTKTLTLTRGGTEIINLRNETPRPKRPIPDGPLIMPPTGPGVAAKRPASPKPPPDNGARSREAAEWVLSRGGWIRIRQDGQERKVHARGGLPDGVFAVVEVGFDWVYDLDDAQLAHFKDLRELKYVSLHSTLISDGGLAVLEGMTKLYKLSLQQTRISDAGLIFLKRLPSLTQLDLSGTQVSDAGVEHLKALTSLTHLWLTGTQVGDAGLKQLKEMPNLTCLELGEQVSDAGLEHLKGMTNLTHLGLSGGLVSDAGLMQLRGMNNLAGLRLQLSQVSDAGLEHLQGLTKLTNLEVKGNTKVTDAGLEKLKGLTELRWLSLDGNTQVSNAGLQHLRELTKLAFLEVTSPKVDDAGLIHLKEMIKLEELDLSRSQISDAGLEHLRTLPKLWRLWLNRTRVSDAGLQRLRTITSLKELRLCQTQVSDAGMEFVKDLTNLEGLWLDHTRVSNAGLAMLATMPKLQVVGLNSSQVTPGGLANVRVFRPGLKAVGSNVDHGTAEAVLKAGGTVWIRVAGEDNDRQIQAAAELPSTGFQLTRVHVPKRAAEMPAPTLGDLNLLREILWDVGLLPNLAELSLAQCGLDHQALTDLKGLQVSHLVLDGNALNGQGLENLRELPDLAELSLANAGITDTSLAYLKGLTNLRRLVLDGNPIAVPGVSSVKELGVPKELARLKELPNLVDLSLANAGIDDAGLAYLKGFTKVRRLVLNGNPIAGRGLRSLKELTQLKELHLNTPTLKGPFAEQLVGLKQLEKLSLAGSGLNDSGISYLARLRNLSECDLTGTKVSAKGVQALQKALPNCAIEHGEAKKALSAKRSEAEAPPGATPPRSRTPTARGESARQGALRVIFEDGSGILALLREGYGQASMETTDRYSGSAAIRVSAGQRYSSRMPGWDYKIRESPGDGQFRYLRFAWKQVGDRNIMLQLNANGKWGPLQGEPGPSFRYEAGPAANSQKAVAIKIDDRLPEDWVVVTRDLFADFGTFSLTGIALSPGPGGYGLFDHIYLARSLEDLNNCPPPISPGREPERLPAKQTQREKTIQRGEWTVLTPDEAHSAGGATLTKLADGSILASGKNPNPESYIVTATCKLDGITAIRLEMLVDASLPVGGPGRAFNGNFVLSEFKVKATPADDPAKSKPVVFQRALADYSQPHYAVDGAIDGDPQTAWAIDPQMGRNHVAVFELREPLSSPNGWTFTFTLDQRSSHASYHNIGRFRLLVTTSKLPIKDPLPP